MYFCFLNRSHSDRLLLIWSFLGRPHRHKQTTDVLLTLFKVNAAHLLRLRVNQMEELLEVSHTVFAGHLKLEALSTHQFVVLLLVDNLEFLVELRFPKLRTHFARIVKDRTRCRRPSPT